MAAPLFCKDRRGARKSFLLYVRRTYLLSFKKLAVGKAEPYGLKKPRSG